MIDTPLALDVLAQQKPVQAIESLLEAEQATAEEYYQEAKQARREERHYEAKIYTQMLEHKRHTIIGIQKALKAVRTI